MQTIAELITERDPFEMWKGIKEEPMDFEAGEEVDAYVSVLEKVDKAVPVRFPKVLVRINTEKPDDENDRFCCVLYTLDRVGEEESEVVVQKKNLPIIMGIYIPSVLMESADELIKNLFCALIWEELQKKKYVYKRIRNALLEDVSGKKAKEKKPCKKKKASDSGLETMKGTFKKTIEKESLKEFPEMGKSFIWPVLFAKCSFTEEVCESLLPDNPPSFQQMYRWMILASRKQNDEIRRYRRLPHLMDRVGSFITEDGYMHSQKTIIVETVRGIDIPIVYTIDSNGDRGELDSSDYDSLFFYHIVILDGYYRRDMTKTVGYILLYATYPLRMKRVMKTKLTELLVNLLNAKGNLMEGEIFP